MKISELESAIAKLRSDLNLETDRLATGILRVGVLVDEQNSRNRIVLEHLSSLYRRQEALEARQFEFEKNILAMLQPLFPNK